MFFQVCSFVVLRIFEIDCVERAAAGRASKGSDILDIYSFFRFDEGSVEPLLDALVVEGVGAVRRMHGGILQGFETDRAGGIVVVARYERRFSVVDGFLQFAFVRCELEFSLSLHSPHFPSAHVASPDDVHDEGNDNEDDHVRHDLVENGIFTLRVCAFAQSLPLSFARRLVAPSLDLVLVLEFVEKETPRRVQQVVVRRTARLALVAAGVTEHSRRHGRYQNNSKQHSGPYVFF